MSVEITGLAGATQFEMPVVNVILLCMEARIVGGEVKLSEEHDEFEWIPLAELHRQVLPAQVRDFMLNYANGKESKQ